MAFWNIRIYILSHRFCTWKCLHFSWEWQASGDNRDTTITDGIIRILQMCTHIQRDKSLIEMPAEAIGVNSKDVTGKQFFIKSYRVKSGIAPKEFWLISGCAVKKFCLKRVILEASGT